IGGWLRKGKRIQIGGLVETWVHARPSRERVIRGHEMDYLGVHVSAAGGISKAVARAAALDTNVMQVMTAVPNRWITKPLEQSEVDAFRRERANHGIVFVVSHEAHLPNRATPDPVLLEKSVRALREEIVRCNLLGINALCIHPGS